MVAQLFLGQTTRPSDRGNHSAQENVAFRQEMSLIDKCSPLFPELSYSNASFSEQTAIVTASGKFAARSTVVAPELQVALLSIWNLGWQLYGSVGDKKLMSNLNTFGKRCLRQQLLEPCDTKTIASVTSRPQQHSQQIRSGVVPSNCPIERWVGDPDNNGAMRQTKRGYVYNLAHPGAARFSS
jgi:hypothetical protein